MSKKALNMGITGQDDSYLTEFPLQDGLREAYTWFVANQDQYRKV